MYPAVEIHLRLGYVGAAYRPGPAAPGTRFGLCTRDTNLLPFEAQSSQAASTRDPTGILPPLRDLTVSATRSACRATPIVCRQRSGRSISSRCARSRARWTSSVGPRTPVTAPL